MKYFILTNPAYVDYVESLIMYQTPKAHVVSSLSDPEIDPENDLVVMYMYNQIVDPDAARFLVNCHPSLLPKQKGSAPQVFSLIEEERIFGWTIHLVGEKVDDGEIVDFSARNIKPVNGFDLWRRQFADGLSYVLSIIESIPTMMHSAYNHSCEGKPHKLAEVNRITGEIEDHEVLRKLVALQYAGYSPSLDGDAVMAFKLTKRKFIKSHEGGIYSFALPSTGRRGEMWAVCKISSDNVVNERYISDSFEECDAMYNTVLQYCLQTRFFDVYEGIASKMNAKE